MSDEHDYDFEWNDVYSGDATDYREPDAELLELIAPLPTGAALDIGCGAGGLVVALVERGWQAEGLDIAPRAIEAARAVLAERGLSAELHVANAASWRTDKSFDLITDSFALPETAAEQTELYQWVREALAPGGSFVLKDFDAQMKRMKQFARFHCPTIDELCAAFEGFEILRAEVVNTPAHGASSDDKGPDEPWTAALLHVRRPSP